MEINLLVVYAVSAIIFAYFKFRTWRKKHPEEEWSESIKVLLAFAAIGGGIGSRGDRCLSHTAVIPKQNL